MSIRFITQKIFQYRKCLSGATAIEFAMLALPFLMLLFGVMEGGRIAWTMNSVQYAIEETSRYASLNAGLSNAEYEDYAQSRLNELSIASTDLNMTSDTATSGGIDFIVLNANYEITTLLDVILPGDFGNFTFETSVRKPVVAE